MQTDTATAAESAATHSFNLLDQTATIVAAYVSRSGMTAAELPKLITDVHNALAGLANVDVEPAIEERAPAVPIKKSVHPDHIVCLEDGLKFKSLKRHLNTHFNMTPDQYREKWGLPANYPMVAPLYSETRSRLAKANGLGKKGAA